MFLLSHSSMSVGPGAPCECQKMLATDSCHYTTVLCTEMTRPPECSSLQFPPSDKHWDVTGCISCQVTCQAPELTETTPATSWQFYALSIPRNMVSSVSTTNAGLNVNNDLESKGDSCLCNRLFPFLIQEVCPHLSTFLASLAINHLTEDVDQLSPYGSL